MKDNDLVDDKIVISLGPNKPVFIDTLKKDSAWLASHGIMDYSLLLGVHHEDGRGAAQSEGGSSFRTMSVQLTDSELERQRNVTNSDASAAPQLESAPTDATTGLGLANNVFCRDRGGIKARLAPDAEEDACVEPDIYFLGIIDILQQYNAWKKSENFIKGFKFDRKEISAVPPKDYAKRFVKFFDANTS